MASIPAGARVFPSLGMREGMHAMPRNDPHGDRMKAYEATADLRLDVHKPIYARIDGRAFSKLTGRLSKPFDQRFTNCMIAAGKALVERTHAKVAYLQSDEISLLFLADAPESSTFFDGRFSKLTSVLASLATAAFIKSLATDGLGELIDDLPHFDCRVCQLPDRDEAANMIAWRFKDATKNAIQSVGQSRFSPRELHGVSCLDIVAMLRQAGFDFDALPAELRTGIFVRRRPILRTLTAAELQKMPKAKRPDGPVKRTASIAYTLPDFIHFSNKADVVLDDAEPQFYKSEAA